MGGACSSTGALCACPLPSRHGKSPLPRLGCPQDLFQSVFGGQTTSNNTSWMRSKLKSALGLAGKKARAASAAGHKR